MYKIKKIIDRSFIIVHKAFTFSRVVLNIPKQNCRENASKITLNQQYPDQIPNRRKRAVKQNKWLQTMTTMERPSHHAFSILIKKQNVMTANKNRRRQYPRAIS